MRFYQQPPHIHVGEIQFGALKIMWLSSLVITIEISSFFRAPTMEFPLLLTVAAFLAV